MVILITGASSGIGFTTAQHLTQLGHTVYGTIRKQPSELLPFKTVVMDVTDNASVQAAVAQLITQEKQIDVLINNAGLGMVASVEEAPEAMVQKLFDTNVWGLMRVCKAVLPIMRQQKSGIIINISSVAAVSGLPFRGLYSASKAAVEMLTEAMSIETKPFGITVCSLLPGAVQTNINNNRMFGDLASGSPYQNTINDLNAKVHDSINTGSDPSYIANCVVKILNARQPKLHYVAASTKEKMSILLKRLLPDRMYEKMIMNHFGLKSLFWAMIVASALSCTPETNTNAPQKYFDVHGFVEQQIKTLNQQKPLTDLLLSLNDKNEQKTTKDIDWSQELTLFSEIDLNKPSYQNSYDTAQPAPNIREYTLKSGEKLPIKSLKVTFDSHNQQPQIIEAHTAEDNTLYSSEKKLTLVCQNNPNTAQPTLASFRIEGSQDLIFTNKKRFSAIGTIK